MKALSFLFIFLITVVAFRESFDDEDDDVDEIPTHSKPRVAWVPILSRRENMSAVVGEALQGDSGDKLSRIGKMLEDSYDQWNRNLAEGGMKFRQLEQKTSSVFSFFIFLSFYLPIL